MLCAGSAEALRRLCGGSAKTAEHLLIFARLRLDVLKVQCAVRPIFARLLLIRTDDASLSCAHAAKQQNERKTDVSEPINAPGCSRSLRTLGRARASARK